MNVRSTQPSLSYTTVVLLVLLSHARKHTIGRHVWLGAEMCMHADAALVLNVIGPICNQKAGASD